MSIKRTNKPESQRKLFDDKSDEELKNDVEDTLQKIETLGKQREELEKNIDRTISKIREWKQKKNA